MLLRAQLVNLIQLGASDFKFSYGAIVVGIVLTPAVMLKNFSMIIRINSWGVISIVFLLFFMIYESADRFASGKAPSVPDTISHNMENLKWSAAGPLCGMLGAGYFSHNALLPIIKNKVNPEHNVRDCSIAYLLVLGSYAIAGLAPSLAFGDVMGTTQNFLLLDVFKHEGLAFVAQGSLLLQLSTVWPLILGLIRSTILEMCFGTPWPSYGHVILHNLVFIGLSTVGTILLHDVVGEVLSYVAAMSGIIYIYLLPFLMTLKELGLISGASGTAVLTHEAINGKQSSDLDEKLIRPERGEGQSSEPGKQKGSMLLFTNLLVFVLGCIMLLLPFANKIQDVA